MDAGSLTKPVFAYGVLQLCNQKQLNLDEPLNNYLKEPYISDERIKKVTARMCLSHQSGFPNWRPDFFKSNPQPLNFQLSPGSRYSYSGEGYLYLQRVIESITKQSLENYIENNIFKPLGISNSGFTYHNIDKSLASPGHTYDKKPIIYHHEKANAAFTLRTTSSDFVKFLQVLIYPPESDSPLLPQEWIDKMLLLETYVNNDNTSWHGIGWSKGKIIENPNVAWGLGWGLQLIGGKKYFWHWGDNEVFRAFTFGSVEDKTGIILMSNCATGSKIWVPILQALYGKKLPIIAYMRSLHPSYL
ncbi:MAG: serine hydrolase domain-containing protein [Promethearchaeota archaeon]|jgi:CubicO group peptidase (beta-lactamase class C family)